mmetsp:Transcript_2429/g.4687  ORF Transcript_2429/g.4687 Transcript_2429/m.4687 type:complete len:222 (-) Transcript_2429:970-1635(-)
MMADDAAAAKLLKNYSGMPRPAKKSTKVVAKRADGKKMWYGIGLDAAKANDNSELAFKPEWDLTQHHGSVTAREALNKGAKAVHEMQASRCEPKDISASPTIPPSAAKDVVTAALVQSEAIGKEHRRDVVARLRDAIAIFECALRKAIYLLLKESDSLRRAAAFEEADTVAYALEEDAELRGSLAGAVSKAMGCIREGDSDLYTKFFDYREEILHVGSVLL